MGYSSRMDFEKLLKPDIYQVFLLSCPASFPFFFARHPWFVVNNKGTVSRFEVVDNPGAYGFVGGREYIWKDGLPPWRGLHMVRTKGYGFPLWSVTLHGALEGEESSPAARMAQYVQESLHTYPYRGRYSYTGPNSNTYVQWVLNKFPNSGLRLPWNAFGKNYKS